MKYRLLIILAIFLPIPVFANEIIEIDFNCYHETENKYVCEVWGNSNETIQAVDFKVSLPSYISQSEFVLEENDFGSGEENWISVIFDEPQSGKIKVGTYNLISEKNVSKDDFTIKELKIIDESYQEVNISNEGNLDVNKVDNKNYLGIKVGVCAIIILIILSLTILTLKKRQGEELSQK